MAGFIYILSNPSIPDQLKIGKSERDPEQYRLSELSNTSVPTPFVMEYYAFVTAQDDLERQLHDSLKSYRTSPQREFFKCTVAVAVSTFQSLAAGKIKFEEYRQRPETRQPSGNPTSSPSGLTKSVEEPRKDRVIMSIYPQQPQDERFRRLRRLLDEEYKKNILYALKEVQVEREERHDPESHSNNNTEHDPYEMFLLFFAIFGGVVFFLFIIAASFR